jgi:hypothetical protein
LRFLGMMQSHVILLLQVERAHVALSH